MKTALLAACLMILLSPFGIAARNPLIPTPLAPNSSNLSTRITVGAENPSRGAEAIATDAINVQSLSALTVGNQFFVAPTGMATGNGSLAAPWDLKTALSHPAAVQPGDTIYLRGGIYNLPAPDRGFASRLVGTLQNPIKVMSYPGEWATIDGNLSFSSIKNVSVFTIYGGHTWFLNFEITNTEISTRKIAIPDSNPPERRGGGVDDQGTGTKLINLVIHDTGQGISSFSNGKNSEYYGNVVYNNGWDAPDRLHGHGSYIQNNSEFKRLENNFFFNSFDRTVHVYGSSNSFNYNLTWVGNTIFNGSMVWWGPNLRNLKLTDNYIYKESFSLGRHLEPENMDATIERNYFMHCVFLNEFSQSVVFKNNTVWCGANGSLVVLNTSSFWAPGKFSINNNTYYKGDRIAPFPQFRVQFKGPKSRLQIVKRYQGEFAFDRITGSQQAAYAATRKSWRDDFGFDSASTYKDSAPTGVMSFVRRNDYSPGRGNIIVYNWDRANTVNVDVSSILSPGDSYELHNVQDYFGDVITGTYFGSDISIDMVGRTQAKPIGYDQTSGWYHNPLKPSTFPAFGTFVIKKTN